MNCKMIDRWMLLSESGELSAREQQMLDEHLAGCPRCADLQAATLATLRQARDVLPTGEPEARVRATLRTAAAERAGGRRLIAFRRPALQVMAFDAMTHTSSCLSKKNVTTRSSGCRCFWMVSTAGGSTTTRERNSRLAPDSRLLLKAAYLAVASRSSC